MGENDKNNKHGYGQKLKKFLGEHSKLNEFVKVGTAALAAGLVAWGVSSVLEANNPDICNDKGVQKNFTLVSYGGTNCTPLAIENVGDNSVTLNIGGEKRCFECGKNYRIDDVDISLHEAQECDADGCKTSTYKIGISSKDANGDTIGATLREGKTYFLCKTEQGLYGILTKKDLEEEFCSINDEVVSMKFNNLCKDCYGGQPGFTAEIGGNFYSIFAGTDNKYGQITKVSVKGKNGEETLLKICAKHYGDKNYRVKVVNQQGDMLYNGIVQENEDVDFSLLSEIECKNRADKIIERFEQKENNERSM